MSFLQSAGAGAALGGGANGAANGLGQLFGTSGSNVSGIADRIGTAANSIARAGGASEGYQGEAPNNFMQYADPDLRAALMKFQPTMPAAPITYSGRDLSQITNGLPGYAR